jgi:hypothetical protein
VGSDRVCLEGTDCQVTSHGKKFKLEPGIYVSAPPSQYSKKVAYLSPVGDISLVQQYRDYLMTSLTTTREAWQGVFEVLNEAPTVKEAMNQLGYSDWTEEDPSSIISKTPLKSVVSTEVNPSPSLFLRKREETEPTTALTEAMQAKLPGVNMNSVNDTLKQAQAVIEIAAQQNGIEMLSEAPLKVNQIIAASYSMASSVMESAQEPTRGFELEKLHAADVFEAIDERVRTFQSKLQKPMNMFNEVQGDTVWDAIYYLHIDQSTQPTAADIRVLEVDVSSLKESSDSLYEGMHTWSNEYNRSLENVAGAQLAADNPAVVELKNELVKKLEDTVSEVEKSASDPQFKEEVCDRLNQSEVQVNDSKDSYQLDDVTIYSGGDVYVCLGKYTLGKVDFGSIVDNSSLLYRINVLLSPGKAAEELVTGISRAASQNLSMDEVFTIASHNSSIPPVFSAKNETGVTEIKNLKTYEDFRCRGKRSGLADRIEEILPIAEKEKYSSTINTVVMSLPHDDTWRTLF